MLELINVRLIEDNDSVFGVVYAMNQKGRSVGVIIRDLELGAIVKLDRGKGVKGRGLWRGFLTLMNGWMGEGNVISTLMVMMMTMISLSRTFNYRDSR